jgi:signal transduction histidine kinase
VKDTGIGVEQKHLENLFDPFYQTKRDDNGSGLGLRNLSFF